MKFIKSKHFLFIISTAILFVPLISSASSIGSVAIGPECTPKVAGTWDDNNPVSQVCSYCPNQNHNFHLKWDIKNNFVEPVCYIGCWVSGGNGCASSVFKLVDKNNNPITRDLYPKDDVYIQNASSVVNLDANSPGTNIQVLCHEKSDATKTKNSMGIRVVSGCSGIIIGQLCELPWDKTVSDLTSGKPTTITEESLYDWTQNEAVDDSALSGGKGSGDKIDIINVMDQMQNADQRIPAPADQNYYDFVHNGYDYVVSTIKASIDNYDPITIGIQTPKGQIGHALLVYGFEDLNNGSNLPIRLYGLNSNVGFYPDWFILCGKAKGNFFPGLGQQYILKCVSNDVYETFIPQIMNKTDCSVGKRVRPKPTEWLKLQSNNPAFKNLPTSLNPYGICLGYSEFIRDVACFGNFVGHDFHYNTDEFIGYSCDINHYPIQKSAVKNKSNNWLASIQTAWQNFIKIFK